MHVGGYLCLLLALAGGGCARLGLTKATADRSGQSPKGEVDFGKSKSRWSPTLNGVAEGRAALARRHRRLAEEAELLGQPRAAIVHLEELVRLEPDDAPAWRKLAELRLSEGDATGAEAAVQRSLREDSGDPAAWLLAGVIRESQGDVQRALAAYYMVLESDHDNVEARLRIAQILLATDRSSHAAPLLRDVCGSPHASDAQLARARRTLGQVYARRGRWDDAVRELGAALAESPETGPDDWYRLACARLRAGQTEQAQNDLKRVLQMNPQHTEAQRLAAAIEADALPGHSAVQHASAEVPATDGW